MNQYNAVTGRKELDNPLNKKRIGRFEMDELYGNIYLDQEEERIYEIEEEDVFGYDKEEITNEE